MICDYIMFLSTISIALILLRISDSYSVECQSQQKEHEEYIQKVSWICAKLSLNTPYEDKNVLWQLYSLYHWSSNNVYSSELLSIKQSIF